jgi:hypothetical protein
MESEWKKSWNLEGGNWKLRKMALSRNRPRMGHIFQRIKFNYSQNNPVVTGFVAELRYRKYSDVIDYSRGKGLLDNDFVYKIECLKLTLEACVRQYRVIFNYQLIAMFRSNK